MRHLPWLIVALACVFPSPHHADACASVGRRGPVPIQGEEALIVWDGRKEHFVRTAGFGPTERDFGFLVPTPARPELSEASDDIFDRLFQIYRRPMPVVRERPERIRGRVVRSAPAIRPAVEVLERRTVAGLDAAVLRADQADALDSWLRTHGYPSSDALRRWIAPYVERRFIVTAFRIDPSAQRSSAFATRAVRMSFDTDAPFFPYSEPQQERAAPARPFRVSVVAPARMRVRSGTASWHGRLGYAARPGQRLVTALSGVVSADSFNERSWLTVFDEPASVRGTQDLYFDRDRSQRRVASSITDPLVPYARHGSPVPSGSEHPNPFDLPSY